MPSHKFQPASSFMSVRDTRPSLFTRKARKGSAPRGGTTTTGRHAGGSNPASTAAHRGAAREAPAGVRGAEGAHRPRRGRSLAGGRRDGADALSEARHARGTAVAAVARRADGRLAELGARWTFTALGEAAARVGWAALRCARRLGSPDPRRGRRLLASAGARGAQRAWSRQFPSRRGGRGSGNARGDAARGRLAGTSGQGGKRRPVVARLPSGRGRAEADFEKSRAAQVESARGRGRAQYPTNRSFVVAPYVTKVQRKRASKVLLANTRGMRSWTLCEVLCPELELQASSQLAQ